MSNIRNLSWRNFAMSRLRRADLHRFFNFPRSHLPYFHNSYLYEQNISSARFLPACFSFHFGTSSKRLSFISSFREFPRKRTRKHRKLQFRVQSATRAVYTRAVLMKWDVNLERHVALILHVPVYRYFWKLFIDFLLSFWSLFQFIKYIFYKHLIA